MPLSISISNKAQSNNLREQILQAAIKIIDGQGYEKLSVRAICRSLGIAIGTFYNNFSSKDDIFSAFYARADGIASSSPAPDNLPYREEMLYHVEVQVNVVLECYKQFGSFHHIFMAMLSQSNAGAVEERRIVFINMVNATIKGQIDGEVRRDMDAQMVARRVFGYVRGLILSWCFYDCGYDLMEAVRGEFNSYLQQFAFDPELRNELNLNTEVLK